MAALNILNSGSSQFSASRSNLRRKSCCCCSEFNFHRQSRKLLKLPIDWTSRNLIYRSFRVSAKLQENDSQNNEEEPPESLFMRELRRRGMTPTSLQEEINESTFIDEEIKLTEEDKDYSKRNLLSTDYEKRLSGQRERSMALNSEGLEGLFPRAKLLLSIGGTFFLGFWPLILIAVAAFFILDLYFGSTFVHEASRAPVTPTPYVDPYTLLEDQRISQPAPLIN